MNYSKSHNMMNMYVFIYEGTEKETFIMHFVFFFIYLPFPKLSSDFHSVKVPPRVGASVVVSYSDLFYNVTHILQLWKRQHSVYRAAAAVLTDLLLKSFHIPPQWTCPRLPSRSRAAVLFCWRTGVSAVCTLPSVRTELWRHRRRSQLQTHRWWISWSHKAQLK